MTPPVTRSNETNKNNTNKNPKAAPNNNIAPRLQEIYSEMRTRQRNAILKAGSMRSDPFFSLSQSRRDDDRRCLAISSVIDEGVDCHWTDAYRRLEKSIKAEFSGLLFSQKVDGDAGVWGQLHWTLMQLVGFPDYDVGEEERYRSEEYLDCIRDSLNIGGMDCAITIKYIGVIVVSTGLLMVGVPSLDINEARDTLRDKLRERGFLLKEPFLNDIVHSTLFRVTDDKSCDQADLHLRLLELAKEFENVHLGTVTLKKFQVGPASWRMLRSEVKEDTPPYLQWELAHNTPRQEYCDNLECTRACYTISGASGANLAKEIKSVLNHADSNASGTSSSNDNNIKIVSPAKNDSPALSAISSSLKTDDYNVNTTLFDSTVPLDDKDLLDDDRAATLTGAGGLALAQELQKKLQDEKRILESLYFTDYF
eukprot:CAMPEP_0172502264 /NCGR_PEP_ID=MMETSP1066-20121228/158302_1 /TAXON_ID=671091 /ORGANISM="Coscinodiscus wailesii, Strain CCMP2513" /LENGTH=423 /DNA_ID=CAMNT_0013277457 /DNA_START=184 /DNA_END=1455 /DNA_ORIENTATION=-